MGYKSCLTGADCTSQGSRLRKFTTKFLALGKASCFDFGDFGFRLRKCGHPIFELHFQSRFSANLVNKRETPTLVRTQLITAAREGGVHQTETKANSTRRC